MSDTKPTHSHSGDEPRPAGSFKRVEYAEDTGGATVNVVGAEGDKSAVESTDELHALTVAELKTKADSLDVESTSGMNKSDLVKEIRKAERKAAK